MKFGNQTSRALKDFFLALSLANLCLLDPWTRVLGLSPNDIFFRKAPPTRMDVVGVIFTVLFLTASFWSVTTILREFGPRWLKNTHRTTFLIFSLVPIHSLLVRTPRFWWLETRICLGFTDAVRHAPSVAYGALALGAVLMIAGIARWGRQLEKVFVPIIMMEIPFVLITFFQAGRQFEGYWRFAREYQDQPAVAMDHVVKVGAHSRVVWLLFDELDRGIIDNHRRFGINLAELDRFTRESVVATNAISPTACTRLSIPTYLSGYEISQVDPTGPAHANITLASTGQSRSWNPQDNLFAQAMSEGYPTAIVGWYIPYCRILKNSFNYCWWSPAYSNSIRTGATIPDDILTQLWNASDATPFGSIALKQLDKVAQCNHRVLVYQELLKHAEQVAADPKYSLVYVHFPIPHPPGFYRAATGQFDCNSDYVDNVSLVDRTLGEMRAAMEASGTWNNSTIIISSDHPYRPWLWGSVDHPDANGKILSDQGLYARVPLLVKLSRQHRTVRYEHRFNTLVLHYLVLALLRGTIDEPEQLAGWLTENTSAEVVPVPITACPPFNDSNGISGSGGNLRVSRSVQAMIHAAE
jgi:Sulfatase